MENEKNTADRHISKVLYFGILASIIFLNMIIIFLVGMFSSRIPSEEQDFLLFLCGTTLLLGSIIIPILLLRKSDDSQTIQLVTWACLEGVVTIGFVHSFLQKENFMLFYTIPALFQMYKSFPKRLENKL